MTSDTLRIATVSELGLDHPTLAQFWEAHWQRRIAPRNPKFYDWQFRRNPSAPGVDHCVIAWDTEENRVAGLMGRNRHTSWIGGKPVIGVGLSSWVISDEYRGKGIGRRTIDFIQERCDLIIGMGISDTPRRSRVC